MADISILPFTERDIKKCLESILLVPSRPTAIVEPSLSICKSKSFSDQPLKNRIQIIPFPIRHNSPWSISTNDESDTGISSFNSNDDQLVTLV
jgi:hypothetical protein